MMLLSHDTRQFFGTTESPSATPKLSRQKFEHFRSLLNLQDVRHLL